MAEEVEFATRKLWGLFSVGKPLVFSDKALSIRGHKIYFSDITSIDKNDSWKHDISYCPVSITTKSGKEYRVNLGNYQLEAESFYNLLIDCWREDGGAV